MTQPTLLPVAPEGTVRLAIHAEPQFTALDWFTVTGRGRCVAVADTNLADPTTLLGRTVQVDGVRYEVRGVEVNLPATGHPRGKPFGLLVTEPAP